MHYTYLFFNISYDNWSACVENPIRSKVRVTDVSNMFLLNNLQTTYHRNAIFNDMTKLLLKESPVFSGSGVKVTAVKNMKLLSSKTITSEVFVTETSCFIA